MFVDDDSHWGLLLETKLTTGFVPEQMTVGKHLGGFHAVHHDTAIVSQYRQHFGHDFLEMAAVAAYEDGIRG